MSSNFRALERKSASHHGDDVDAVVREISRIQDGINNFATEAKSQYSGLNARLSELEQKSVRRGVASSEEFLEGGPLAEMAAQSDLYGRLVDQPGSARLTTRASLKALAKAVTSDTPTGFPVLPARAQDIYGLAPRRFRLLEVLPSVPFASNALEYPQLDVDFADAADYQLLEGDQKAETNAEFDAKTATVATIAHWVRASKQVLSDAPILQRWLENLLRYGVLRKVEQQLVNGTGVGKTLRGLLTAASAASVTATKPADALGEAAVGLSVAGWEPNLVIMHPVDEFKIMSERTTTGEYVAGGWSTPNQSNIWSLQRIATPAIAAGTALVLDRNAVLVLDREQPAVLISTEDRDNFIRNLVTILGEIRLGLAILNPAAIKSVVLPT